MPEEHLPPRQPVNSKVQALDKFLGVEFTFGIYRIEPPKIRKGYAQNSGWLQPASHLGKQADELPVSHVLERMRGVEAHQRTISKCNSRPRPYRTPCCLTAATKSLREPKATTGRGNRASRTAGLPSIFRMPTAGLGPQPKFTIFVPAISDKVSAGVAAQHFRGSFGQHFEFQP